MTESGTGPVIYELRKQIQKLRSELDSFSDSSPRIPELIQSANLLRTNEYLRTVNSKRSDLIAAYEKYSKELEQMLETVFEIQKDLKEILKTQTSLISESKPTKTKTRKKTPKK